MSRVEQVQEALPTSCSLILYNREHATLFLAELWRKRVNDKLTTLSRMVHDHMACSGPQTARHYNEGGLTRTSPNHTTMSSHRTSLSHTSSLSNQVFNTTISSNGRRHTLSRLHPRTYIPFPRQSKSTSEPYNYCV